MRYFVLLLGVAVWLIGVANYCGRAQIGDNKPAAPLRIGVVGLVHGHVSGFFRENRKHADINIVGIAEPDQELASRYAKRYGFDQSLMFANVEEMLQKTRPQAVVTYTNTRDHRSVVEICARHGVHVMMEKPLA